jgi:hypothetical protein
MMLSTTYRNRTRISRIQNAFRIRSTDGNLFSDSGDSEHVARRDRELGSRLNTVTATLRRLEGSTLGHVLEAGAEEATRRQTTRRRRPRG